MFGLQRESEVRPVVVGLRFWQAPLAAGISHSMANTCTFHSNANAYLLSSFSITRMHDVR